MTDNLKSFEMVKTAVQALDNKKALNITVIDIHEISILADYFIIATGNNINQLHALSDQVEEDLAKTGHHPIGNEGYHHANWILLDYNDVIIHIFDKESRSFYNLERVWSDGKIVDMSLIEAK